MKSLLNSEQQQNLVLFIGGAPRSGTTLLQKILSLNSRISAGPEFDHLPGLMHQYIRMKNGLINNRQVFYYDVNTLRQSFRLLIQDLIVPQSGNIKLISEKTPDNALVFEQLYELFPDGKFILVIRDPRAIINSFKEVQRKAKKIGNTKVRIGKNLNYDVGYVRNSITKGSNFIERHPSNGMFVYYEDLIQSPDETVKNVCNFLGIAFESEMLETSKRNEMSDLADKKQITELPFISDLFDKNISDSSLNTWRKSLTWLDKLIIANYFNQNKIKCLNRYAFERPGLMGRLVLIIIEIISYVAWTFKRLIKRLFFSE